MPIFVKRILKKVVLPFAFFFLLASFQYSFFADIFPYPLFPPFLVIGLFTFLFLMEEALPFGLVKILCCAFFLYLFSSRSALSVFAPLVVVGLGFKLMLGLLNKKTFFVFHLLLLPFLGAWRGLGFLFGKTGISPSQVVSPPRLGWNFVVGSLFYFVFYGFFFSRK